MYKNDMAKQLIISGTVAFPVGWSAVRHQHPHHELILITHGSLTSTVGDAGCTATTGDIILYQPGVLHQERNSGRRSLGMIYVHASLDPSPTPLLQDPAGRLGQLVRWLAEDQAAGAPSDTLTTWVEAIRTQARHCSAGLATDLADAVRSILRAQVARPHSLEGLARSVGLGPRQLLRQYRAQTRTTPMADLRRMRCEAAASLLASTDWALERIAQEVGFCDAFHLSKVFRAHFGLPPGRMRSRGSSSSRQSWTG
jgi:AraC-like DNA-binding protein